MVALELRVASSLDDEDYLLGNQLEEQVRLSVRDLAKL